MEFKLTHGPRPEITSPSFSNLLRVSEGNSKVSWTRELEVAPRNARTRLESSGQIAWSADGGRTCHYKIITIIFFYITYLISLLIITSWLANEGTKGIRAASFSGGNNI